MSGKTGKVMLVGAGPGDPELLTLKAAKALKAADIILYDALVSKEVLEMANPESRKIPVGKKGHGQSCRQSDINEMMVSFAREGKNILRLKGGDPLIFSRAGEEIEAMREAGIAVEIISGITTAQGAAAMLGIPLTHRESARRLQFVTGHDHKGGLPTDFNWQSLADKSVTTVVYMPKKTLASFSGKVQECGLPADTPAVAVMNATLPTQRVVTATIATLPFHPQVVNMEGAVLVIIGEVAGLKIDGKA
jgi:uroporphyrin-III C-methyltransferase/precorrin-2 dehydrogenase/sirohydrochlorin ferrochelatase